MGGTDPDNITMKVVQALGQLPAGTVEARVVVGGDNRHRPELEEAVRRTPGLELRADVRDMPSLMAWADVAVSAAGSTSWELAFMGLPTLSIVLADNQSPVAEALERHRLAWALGEGTAMAPSRVTSALRELLADPRRRAAMSRQGRSFVDGRGPRRVVEAMLGIGGRSEAGMAEVSP
jgi:spore coat polysaccharide biosynthesis predicted glycosyltransferase SpsG